MKKLLRRLSDWCLGVPQSQFHERVQLTEPQSPLLIVVEGPHDIEFLRRISALLHGVQAELPNLAQAEAAGQVSFLPAGGGNLWSWPARLGPLRLRQLHIYDREIAPVTQQRQQLIDAINARPNCRAVLTRKRALENYLHSHAILQAGVVQIELTDDDSVPLLVAQAVQRSSADGPSWAELSPRARKRRCERAKCWLNTRAVDRMTVELLMQRDPHGEIAGWLYVISQLMGQAC